MKIDQLKEKLELDLRELQVFMNQAESNDKQLALLGERERELRQMEAKLEAVKATLDKERTDFESQKKYVDNLQIEIGAKELIVEHLAEKEKEIETAQTLLDQREGEIKDKEAEVEVKLKESASLLEKEKELNHRELLLKKEMLADELRKEQLDQREKDIAAEQLRLQTLGEKWTEKGIQ